MNKFKDVVINIKAKTDRYKEMEKLAKKLNMPKEEMAKKLNNMYIMKGAKYEEYFRNYK